MSFCQGIDSHLRGKPFPSPPLRILGSVVAGTTLRLVALWILEIRHWFQAMISLVTSGGLGWCASDSTRARKPKQEQYVGATSTIENGGTGCLKRCSQWSHPEVSFFYDFQSTLRLLSWWMIGEILLLVKFFEGFSKSLLPTLYLGIFSHLALQGVVFYLNWGGGYAVLLCSCRPGKSRVALWKDFCEKNLTSKTEYTHLLHVGFAVVLACYWQMPLMRFFPLPAIKC